MDILRKMFKLQEQAGDAQDKDATAKDEFRKPTWFEESETDDELVDDDREFTFQIFTNPLELQKHFERQMQQIMEAVSEFEDGEGVKVEKNLKEEFLKPGFESNMFKEFEKQQKGFLDTDLDGEIYADQLHSLIQRLNPSEPTSNILPRNDNKNNRSLVVKKRLSDEETILGRIHGTLLDEDSRKRMPHIRPDVMAPMGPMLPRSATPFGGAFDDGYKGPKMFKQSVMTKTIRKPDGSYETTKILENSQGHKTTTITRTVDGKSETVTTYDGPGESGTIRQADGRDAEVQVYSDRNIYVTKKGYAVPRNLW